MPRKARIDAPGALHHIIARGIERRRIFKDDKDRAIFVKRLGRVISSTQTDCFAWALMPNHVHLLLRTGNTPIATVMSRLLTGYAVQFNKRHERHGHLFQNRYKSILCQQEPYFLELVRYIHLNPLRAKLVADYQTLRSFAFAGHGALLGKYEYGWQNTDYVLSLFASRMSKARALYSNFVRQGIGKGRRPDLVGGGLIRSAGGWEAVKLMRATKDRIKGDERILGDGGFVQAVLDDSQQQLERRYFLRSEGFDLDWLIGQVADLLGIEQKVVLRPGRYPETVQARSVLFYWAVRDLGITTLELSKRFNVSQPTASQSVKRGEKIVIEKRLKVPINLYQYINTRP